ncbi:hypothetical protein PIB30_056449 [Stylosanthes scabra]|uniref:Uncharacterized protein n=1 Tax=Stylosanthes scabra TaxID=79078 RepID=A0ABU6WHW3_9FABA|nr:hypothetical protein [Stylosanthes scabra]
MAKLCCFKASYSQVEEHLNPTNPPANSSLPPQPDGSSGRKNRSHMWEHFTPIDGTENLVQFQFSVANNYTTHIPTSNPSLQTPIHYSRNSQHSDFANPRGLDVINFNDDKIGNQKQRSTPLWQWEDDEMLISAWLNISTDPVVDTD